MKKIVTKNVNEANVVTHGGIFHADEIFATVILAKVRSITVYRTFRVPKNLEEDVIVYDIGGGKFDHHQKDGNGARENGVPYSSAGLIWKEFGPELTENTSNPQLVWDSIDKSLIQGIDAIDNGVLPKADYPVQAMSIASVISSFNPTWDSEEDADEAFERAVDFAEIIFDNIWNSAVSKLKAQEIVEEAIEASEEHIMILEIFAPWQEVLFSSENEKAQDVWFVVFPSNRGGYNWQCVPDELGSFGQRKQVPSEWKGLRDEELQKVTGVATAIFCHNAGFIGATETLQDAIKLAKLAVKS